MSETLIAGAYREAQGPDQFLDATKLLLNDSRTQLVVVHDLVDPSIELALRKAHRADRADLLREAVPAMAASETYVAEWWQANGYSNYPTITGWRYGDPITMGTEADYHVDRPVYKAALSAGLTLSLGFGDDALWRAARPSQPLSKEDGSFSRLKYFTWLANVAFGHFPRYEHIGQAPGDGVLFAQHPNPTAHEVMAGPRREAHTFELLALRRP